MRLAVDQKADRDEIFEVLERLTQAVERLQPAEIGEGPIDDLDFPPDDPDQRDAPRSAPRIIRRVPVGQAPTPAPTACSILAPRSASMFFQYSNARASTSSDTPFDR